MPAPAYRPRIIIEITEEQRRSLTKYLAYGEQGRVFQAIVQDITTLLDEFGHDFVSYMLRREFSYRVPVEEFSNAHRRPDSATVAHADERSTASTDPEHPGAAPYSDEAAPAYDQETHRLVEYC